MTIERIAVHSTNNAVAATCETCTHQNRPPKPHIIMRVENPKPKDFTNVEWAAGNHDTIMGGTHHVVIFTSAKIH